MDDELENTGRKEFNINLINILIFFSKNIKQITFEHLIISFKKISPQMCNCNSQSTKCLVIILNKAILYTLLGLH